MKDKENKEILDELEGNNKPFRIIKLLDTIVYAKDKHDAIKKAKSKHHEVTESRIIEERSEDFKKNFGIATNYDWVSHEDELKKEKKNG